MALIIEPDSLPNMASNMSDPHCANSATAYKEGIPYAIKKLHEAAPQAVMYMDAAHGGWLGWSDNMTASARLVKDMNVHTMLRGFATNVANYQPLGRAQCPWTPSAQPDRNEYCLNGQHGNETCCEDPCRLCG
jgi:cellulose 1,4-beta-cellobiosidase